MDFSKAYVVMYAGGTLKGAVRRAGWSDEYWMLNKGAYLMRCSLAGIGPEGAEPTCHFPSTDKSANDWVAVTSDQLKKGAESYLARIGNPFLQPYQFVENSKDELLRKLPGLVKKLWWASDPENPYRTEGGCRGPMGECGYCLYLQSLEEINQLIKAAGVDAHG